MALGKQLREARERLGLTASEVASATRMKVQTVEAIEREDFARIAAPIYGKGFIKLYAERVGLDSHALIEEYMKKVGATKMPVLDAEGPARRTSGASPAATLPDESQLTVVGREEPTPESSETPAAGSTRKSRQKPAPAPVEELDLFAQARQREVRPEPRPAVVAPTPVPPPPAPEPIRRTSEPAPAPTPTPPADSAGAPRSGLAESFRSMDEWVSSLQIWRSPLRAISVVVGIVFILLLIISAISRFTTSRKTVGASQPRPELQMVVQAPEPYFE